MSVCSEYQLDEFAKSAGVMIHHRLRVAECFQQRIHLREMGCDIALSRHAYNGLIAILAFNIENASVSDNFHW